MILYRKFAKDLCKEAPMKPDDTLTKILHFAQTHKDIEIVVLEGSRANKHAKKDRFQDYDISFFMEDTLSLRQDISWLGHFGKILMMQMPESMELFPPDLKDGWESYLVLYENGVKIDFTLIPLSDVEYYFTHEKLTQVLLDKNDIVSKTMGREIIPSDEDFWLKPLTQRSFDDCLNEFYHLKGYALRSFLRNEELAYNHYIDSMRETLLILLSWQAALQKRLKAPSKKSPKHNAATPSFSFSYGKHYKYLPHSMPKKYYKLLLQTYTLGNLAKSRRALKAMQILCDTATHYIAKHTGFIAPSYKAALKTYYRALKTK